MSKQLVKFAMLGHQYSLPLIITPNNCDVFLNEWAISNTELIRDSLQKHGALLFRDFKDTDIHKFEDFTKIASSEIMTYKERSSPRHEVANNIYTSTDYPPSQKIFPHNEHSYSLTIPLKLFFYCSIPPNSGGETPIADCRKILKRLSPETIEKFRLKKWMYVRNFGDGFGLPWETVFQTENKEEVEKYCASNLIDFEWKNNYQLRTKQIRPALIKHPYNQEEIWFNHLTFFHISTLNQSIRSILLESFDKEDLPNNTYYGDGSKIEDNVLDELRNAYLNELVTFAWKQNDILLIDNVLTAHARNAFTKPREILVSMADPYTRIDL